jgi:uncharacterized protein YjbI with pentapeptide repeats
MAKRRGCVSQWPYLFLGAALGALVVYQRGQQSSALAQASSGWQGIDERERTRSQAEPPITARLKGADLRYADLRSTNLTGADLQAAKLRGANLQCAGLALSNLSAADLSEAILYRAVLFGANLQGATLIGADLRSANLNLANLQAADVSAVQMDERTVLPNNERWTPDADLSRFTDSRHALFWQSPAFVVETP